MTSANRRALTLGAVVVGFWLGGRMTLAGFRHAGQIRDELVLETMRLEQARREVASIPALTDSIKRLEAVVGRLPQLLLAGSDRDIASLDLVRRITLLTGAHPVWVDSVRAIPDEVSTGLLDRASVVVFVETDLRGLTDLIAGVEADPLLQIDRVDIRARNPMDGPEAVEALQIELVCTGWFRAMRSDSLAKVAE